MVRSPVAGGNSSGDGFGIFVVTVYFLLWVEPVRPTYRHLYNELERPGVKGVVLSTLVSLGTLSPVKIESPEGLRIFSLHGGRVFEHPMMSLVGLEKTYF